MTASRTAALGGSVVAGTGRPLTLIEIGRAHV